MSKSHSNRYMSTMLPSFDPKYALPLWHPGPCCLGDIGYVREGKFHSLFNIKEGAQNDNMQRTSEDETSAASGQVSSISTANMSYQQSSIREWLGGELDSDDSTITVMFSQLAWVFERSEVYPPPPWTLEEENVSRTVWGACKSSQYRSNGISVSGKLTATGVPLSQTLSFESSSKSGAMLITRKPVEHLQVKNRRELKAYFALYKQYLFDKYGRRQDIKLGDLMLVYGMDCTTDWAISITTDSSEGSRAEFDVFAAAKAGVWGEWKKGGSMSHAGPYRVGDKSSHPTQLVQLDRNASDNQVAVDGNKDAQQQLGLDLGLGLGDSTFSSNLSLNPSSQEEPLNETMPEPQIPSDWKWDERYDDEPVNQAVVLRRITAKTRFSFPNITLVPAKLRTGGPAQSWLPPDMRTGGHVGGSRIFATSAGSGTGGHGFQNRDAKVCPITPEWDYIDIVHWYILRNTSDSVWCSIASDEDVDRLMQEAKRLLPMHNTSWLQKDGSLNYEHVLACANLVFNIHTDSDGFALVEQREMVDTSIPSREAWMTEANSLVPPSA